MCRTCGCSYPAPGLAHDDEEGHEHGHERDHYSEHGHGHEHRHGREDADDHGGDHRHRDDTASAAATGVVVTLEQRVLERNDRLAAETRRRLRARHVFAINLMSAPGAGKTTLLERMVHDLRGTLPIVVIEGDQATDRDAERVRAAGGRAVQINTGAGCHLDAAMVARALDGLEPSPRSLVVIENVGNLVCPALFDLGESARVVVTAVTDGEDKPLKYPHMFHAADLLLLNKIDLLRHVRFDRERFWSAARAAKPGVVTLEISATRGDGLDALYTWLRAAVEKPWDGATR